MKYPGLMAVVFVASIFVADAMAQNKDAELRIQIESPPANTQIAQIGEIRGWATHPTEEVIVINMYVDGEYFSEVPVGGQRGDVQNAFPNHVNSLYSGWSQTTNFKSPLHLSFFLENIITTILDSYIDNRPFNVLRNSLS